MEDLDVAIASENSAARSLRARGKATPPALIGRAALECL